MNLLHWLELVLTLPKFHLASSNYIIIKQKNYVKKNACFFFFLGGGEEINATNSLMLVSNVFLVMVTQVQYFIRHKFSHSQKIYNQQINNVCQLLLLQSWTKPLRHLSFLHDKFKIIKSMLPFCPPLPQPQCCFQSRSTHQV